MKPAVILVRPQMGENIGAVARAMKNFGLSELRLVAPRDGWPNPKAAEMAAHGADIVAAATVHETLAAAVADRQFVLASSARPRFMPIEMHDPQAGATRLRQEEAAGHATALLFGPERSGLENDDLAHCHGVITIPTAPGCASLNIAQSAVLLLYQWFATSGIQAEPTAAESPATQAELEGLTAHLVAALDRRTYFHIPDKRRTMLRHLQSMLLKPRWSAQEVRTLRGMIRALDEIEPDSSARRIVT